MMTIDDIIHDYNNGVYTPEKVVIPNKYPADYVFDENMSVKWNRECVLSENSKIDDMRKKAADEENRLCKLLRRQVIDYIALSLAEYDKMTSLRAILRLLLSSRQGSLRIITIICIRISRK